MHPLMYLLLILLGLAITVLIGLKTQPASFAAYPQTNGPIKSIPLADDLPEPVARFYRIIYGEEIPVLESAVISGKASMRLFGVTFPGRFRFTHIAGQGYRHYMESTLFGIPIMKVNEYFLDGKGRMKLPFGVIEGEWKVDQAANLGMWSEMMWLPAVYLSDPRVRWEAVDEHTALLYVPAANGEETFIARFDPDSGLLQYFEAMRYREAADEHKILWIDEALTWIELQGQTTLGSGAVTWFDQGRPWAIFTTEEIVFNMDVNEYIRAAGL